MNTMNSSLKLSSKTMGELLSLIIVTFPIMFCYAAGIHSISLADAFLLIWVSMWVALFPHRKNRIDGVTTWSIIIILYFLMIFAGKIVGDSGLENLLKFGRYFLYFAIAVYVCPMYDSYAFAKRTYRFLSIFTTILLIVQYIGFYIFRVQIYGFIPFLPLMGADDWQTLQYLNENVTVYRPCSMFGEPSHYAAYVAGYMGISLWDKNEKNRTRLFLTLGLVLSSSSTAIACAALLWVIWMISNRKVNVSSIILIAVAAVGAFLTLQTNSIQYVIERVFISGNGVYGRFHTYAMLFQDLKRSPLGFIFGHGFTYEQRYVYIPGVGAFFYNFGIVGCVLLTMLIFKVCRKMMPERKVLILILIILSVGTLALVSYNVMLYLGLAMLGISSVARQNESARSWKRKGNSYVLERRAIAFKS